MRNFSRVVVYMGSVNPVSRNFAQSDGYPRDYLWQIKKDMKTPGLRDMALEASDASLLSERGKRAAAAHLVSKPDLRTPLAEIAANEDEQSGKDIAALRHGISLINNLRKSPSTRKLASSVINVMRPAMTRLNQKMYQKAYDFLDR